MRNSADGKRVVAHNLPPVADHIGPGCAAFLILKSPAAKPVVQFRNTTFKLRQIVCGI
jgi:hypothetical protein